MRHLAMSLFSLAACASLDAQSLQQSIESRLEHRNLLCGVSVVDLDTGQPLVALRASLPMTPASNAKLFSTALALTRLGPNHLFETRILLTQSGDLVLVGGGDPTLSNRPIPYRKGPVTGDPLQAIEDFASQLFAQGLRQVRGDIIGDDTLYPWSPYPDGWTVDDTINDYGAPISALSLNDNALTLTVRPGDPPVVFFRPSVEYYSVLNDAHNGSDENQPLTVDRLPGARVLELSGAVPPSGRSLTVAIDDPALFAARALASALTHRGVAIYGRVLARHRRPGTLYQPPAGEVLLSRPSPPLLETLRTINKVSHNLQAELVLLEASRVQQGDALREAATKELERFVEEAGISADETHFEDASGLSRKTLTSPQAITRLLVFMNSSPNAEAYASTLPVGGDDGSLSSRFRSVAAAARIRAKTGSIRHVASLSGYILDRDGRRRLAFSIIVNDATARAREVRELIDTIAVAILQKGIE
jgi:serine-type D-Ala-D-Ala carboxypeptidase/endopeptidase (penicillin-binding protein 4)